MCELEMPQRPTGVRLLRAREDKRAALHHERTILVIEDDPEMRRLIEDFSPLLS